MCLIVGMGYGPKVLLPRAHLLKPQPQGDSAGSQVFGKWLGLEDRVHVPGDWHVCKRLRSAACPFSSLEHVLGDKIGGRSAQPIQQICQSLDSGLSRCLSYDKQNRTKPTKQKTPTLCIVSIKWRKGKKKKKKEHIVLKWGGTIIYKLSLISSFQI